MNSELILLIYLYLNDNQGISSLDIKNGRGKKTFTERKGKYTSKYHFLIIQNDQIFTSPEFEALNKKQYG